MRPTKFRLVTGAALVSAMLVLLGGGASAASREKLLHVFGHGNDGYNPYDRPVLDQAGNVYGTTEFGGDINSCPSGCGIVFRLENIKGRWRESRYELNTATAWTLAGLVFDKRGHLYGTALGHESNGSVFEMTYSSGQWQQNVLYEFKGNSDGSEPASTLTVDQHGKLYGTTIAGGGRGSCNYGGLYCGTVFELAPNSTGGWVESVLYSFAGGIDGSDPEGGNLTLDSKANLFGATSLGGGAGCNRNLGCGTLFELSPNSDGTWTKTMLHSFTGGSDGSAPSASLVFDKRGNLYGEAGGGGAFGYGVVFELSPSKGGWTENVLYNFAGGSDGNNPVGGVVFDKAGNLYGSTGWGGNGGCYKNEGCGTVFKLSPSNGGWTETVLYKFSGSSKTDGASPIGVVLDNKGSLYGTSFGYSGGATVFEITP